MTQNEVSIIKNAVLDATEAYVDARLNMASFVKTQIGVVTYVHENTTTHKYEHTVKCNATSGSVGVTYTKVLSVGNVQFPVDSVVFLIAPNAQFTNQFILGKLDSTPANIVGGSIKIGKIPNTTNDYYFNVDSNGNLNINNKFGVTNEGELNINNKFYVKNTGALYIGADGTSAKFYVDVDGNVTAKGGTIGGFTISGTTGLTRTDSNKATSELTADHLRISKWTGRYKISAIVDASNERIAINSDSGSASIQVSSAMGWDNNGNFVNPNSGNNYFKMTPTSLEVKANGLTYTCGTDCFKMLSQSQNAGGLGDLQILVSTNLIIFKNVSSGRTYTMLLS